MASDNTTNLRQVSTSLPEDVWQIIDAERAAEDRTMSAHIRRILRQHADKISRPAAYPPNPSTPWAPAAPAQPYVGDHDPNIQVRWEDDPALAGKVGAQPNSRDYNDEGLA